MQFNFIFAGNLFSIYLILIDNFYTTKLKTLGLQQASQSLPHLARPGIESVHGHHSTNLIGHLLLINPYEPTF